MKRFFYSKKNCHFTLLEVLIAFSLVTMLSGVLLYGIVHVVQEQVKWESLDQELQDYVYAHSLLAASLHQVNATIEVDGETKVTWKQEGGVDRDPAFAGEVTASLMLQEEGLYLLTHSLRQLREPRRQLLLKGVSDCRWELTPLKEGWVLKISFEWRGLPWQWVFAKREPLTVVGP